MLFSLLASLYMLNQSTYDFSTFTLISNASQPSSHGTPLSVDEPVFDRLLWDKVASANANQTNKQNENQYGPLNDSSLVIVVQVHKRLTYLRTLIESLARVKHIESALVIFSHDHIDNEINQLIAGINFTRAVQIFYPFSTQIWKHTFPGTSPNDCSRDLSKEAALRINCSNAKYPDTYGHYRESFVTQTKHHWWWKVNYIFDHLAYTKNKANLELIFLEEDHYLLPDLIHTWRLLKKERKRLLDEEQINVDMLTFGSYEKNYNAEVNANKMNLIEWYSSKHNMAFTFDRALFDKFKLFSAEFCVFDDYNWDWTLQHVQESFDETLLTIHSIVPRVFHIGSCGVHHKTADCSPEKQVKVIEEMYTAFRSKFFPAKVSVMRRQGKKTKMVNNGGWNDPRDHQLCIQYELPLEQIIRKNANFKPFLLNSK